MIVIMFFRIWFVKKENNTKKKNWSEIIEVRLKERRIIEGYERIKFI